MWRCSCCATVHCCLALTLRCWVLGVVMAVVGHQVMWWSMNPNGSVPPGGQECVGSCTDGSTTPRCNSNYTRGQTFTTYVSWTLNANFTQWSEPLVIQEGTVTSQDTNMAAVILENRSVVGLYRSKQYAGCTGSLQQTIVTHRHTSGTSTSHRWFQRPVTRWRRRTRLFGPPQPARLESMARSTSMTMEGFGTMLSSTIGPAQHPG